MRLTNIDSSVAVHFTWSGGDRDDRSMVEGEPTPRVETQGHLRLHPLRVADPRECLDQGYGCNTYSRDTVKMSRRYSSWPVLLSGYRKKRIKKHVNAHIVNVRNK